jgi:competence protein ComEC
VTRSAKDNFMIKEWLAADADARPVDDASLAQAVSCDEAGCVAQMTGGGYATLALRPEALADDCARAAVIVTWRQPPMGCAALVIGRDQLQKRGTMVLRQTRSGFAIDTVRSKGLIVPGRRRAETMPRRISQRPGQQPHVRSMRRRRKTDLGAEE